MIDYQNLALAQHSALHSVLECKVAGTGTKPPCSELDSVKETEFLPGTESPGRLSMPPSAPPPTDIAHPPSGLLSQPKVGKKKGGRKVWLLKQHLSDKATYGDDVITEFELYHQNRPRADTNKERVLGLFLYRLAWLVLPEWDKRFARRVRFFFFFFTGI